MSICTDSCVSYSSPAHGGWGLVRIGMLVPESHQLFVCPFACGRHGAIGATIHGNKERLSYLYLEETDLISGCYEDLIVQSIDELLEHLDHHPRALLIMVSCIDDLLATDHESLLSIFAKKYPDIRFGVGHMNPIASDGKLPPHLNIQRLIYSFLETGEHPALDRQSTQSEQASMQASMQASVQSKNTVNIIGCNMAPAASGELYSVLADLGYLALHIGQFVNFDDFQSMSASSLNLLTTTAGQLAANEMQENFGISQLLLPVNWDLETIKDDYQTLAAALAVDSLPEATVELLDCLQQQAQDSLNATRLDLDNRPIAIDDTATTRPYSLAAMLYKNGFNVIAIATDGCPDIEQESLEWLQANTDVQTLDYNSHNAPRSRTARPEVLAIGMECAYLLQTSLIVDMTNDEQHYGYHGLLWLLEQMRAAVELEVDLEQSLTAHGLVI